MRKSEAEQLVRNTFNQAYDEAGFRRFIDELFHDYEREDTKALSGSYIPEAFQGRIHSYKRLAKFTDPEGLTIDVLAVKVVRRSTLENARTMQRNFIARYLNGSRGGNLKDAALVAFYSDDCEDWRFSLVRMDYILDEEKQKIHKQLTPARRYSFLVGKHEKTHTACQQLLPVLQANTETTLSVLEAAFNIETVTKEFFEKYKALYLSLKEALENQHKTDSAIKTEFETKAIKTDDFAKRLLGQIVFLYFLQKKGWLGVAKGNEWGSGPKDFLQLLYRGGYSEYQNFFNDVLEPLFYEALATERHDHYYDHLKCRIPFLNGGLFEAIHNYDWVNTDILLDNAIFQKIFDIFDLYNFTVREDEPLDKEVAVDPEMLGKVFENLIPENERKGSGTYYTPREIVHYMCQESLINYLDAKLNIESRPIEEKGQQREILDFGKPDLLTNYEDVYAPVVPREDIADFIYYGDVAQEHDATAQVKTQNENYKGDYRHKIPETVRKYASQIDDALTHVKICDPAIGSGAFPVGVMNEIIRARGSLNAYLGDEGRRPYDFKRHTIQESIYGVDIEPSAVDIAKLRLWLSLVVDEEDFGTIKPLPNLDYKILAGDSLLGIDTKNDMIRAQQLGELEQLKAEYFSVTSPSRKIEIKGRVDEIICDLTSIHTKSAGVQQSTRFDYHLFFSEVFRENNGFDIVIANPPYVSIEKFSGTTQQKTWKNLYDVFAARGDVYCLFFELGFKILRKYGNLCYITSNKYFRADYGKALREYMVKHVTPLKIIDFGELPVFEVGTDPSIVLVQSVAPEKDTTTKVATVKDKNEIQDVRSAFSIRSNTLNLSELNPEGWGFEESSSREIITKISKQGIPLKKYVKGHFNRGILTGFNEAFVIDEETRNNLIQQDETSEQLIKPWLRGTDIKRWYYDYNNLYIIVIRNNFHLQLSKYPAILSHLEQHKTKLRERAQCEGKKDQPGTKQHHWLELDNNPTEPYISQFEKPKLVYNETSKKLHAFVDYDNLYINKTGFIIVHDDVEYILGILNSQLFDFFYRHEFPSWGNPWAGGRIQFRGTRMAKLPITQANTEQKNEISEAVNKIQNMKMKDHHADVSILEKIIDKLVYQLYGLTPEEIAIVEEAVQ